MNEPPHGLLRSVDAVTVMTDLFGNRPVLVDLSGGRYRTGA